MKKIQMVDLLSQYENIQSDIDEAVLKVIRSSWYIGGPEVKKFQEALESKFDVKHVIPCGNGTDALQIAMMSLDLNPGDEVIVPSFTFVATAEVIVLLGFIPVMVDVDLDTFNLSLESVKQAITPKTKAIVPVHLFGQNANMEGLKSIAEEHNLYIIEDAAQSINSEFSFSNGEKAFSGTMGDFGTTSFFPSKNLGAYGDGGAIFTNDDALAKMARTIANHGMTVRYHHDIIGVNSRLDAIQAAILSIKLNHLDSYTSSRIQAASYYDEAFKDNPNVIIPERSKQSNHVFHQYTLRIIGDRDGLQKHLMDKEIPAMIYYPIPLHMQKAYTDSRYIKGDFPNTEKLSKEVISLPMHSELKEDQLEFICEAVNTFTKK